MASKLGLEGVSIGLLAGETGLSKSGLFAHFNSKENLQLAIVHYAGLHFTEAVVNPALKCTRGIARIVDLIERWIGWGDRLTGGCIFVSASTEFSDRPGLVRDLLVQQQQKWLETLKRVAQSAIKAGDFRGDIDLDQFAFDLYSLLLGVHYYRRMLGNSHAPQHQRIALMALLTRYSNPDTDLLKYFS